MIRQAIKQELQARGWTGKKLSDETGIRHPTLTEFLNGNKGLSIELLERVCEKLNLELRTNK